MKAEKNMKAGATETGLIGPSSLSEKNMKALSVNVNELAFSEVVRPKWISLDEGESTVVIPIARSEDVRSNFRRKKGQEEREVRVWGCKLLVPAVSVSKDGERLSVEAGECVLMIERFQFADAFAQAAKKGQAVRVTRAKDRKLQGGNRLGVFKVEITAKAFPELKEEILLPSPRAIEQIEGEGEEEDFDFPPG